MTNQGLKVDFKTPFEIIPMGEAAERLGVGIESLRAWLKRNPDVKEKYVTKERIFGRKRFVIKDEALMVIANMRNLDSKNQHRVGFSKGKQKLAEKVAENAVEEAKVIQVLERIDKRLNELEEAAGIRKPLPVALLPAKTTEEPLPIDTRSLLVQRLRDYTKENDLDYYVPWTKLYEEMYYRYHINVRTKAKNEGISGIDLLEKENLIEEAWKVACKVFELKGDKITNN